MDLLETFWTYEVSQKVSYKLWDVIENYEADYSEFNVIDNEEGDYGIIKYSDENGVIAIRTVYGGDQEETEFTEYGKKLMKEKVMQLINECFDNL